MMRLISVLMLGITCSIFLLNSSCKQSAGDRCQLDTDCSEGLLCCVDPGQRAAGGVCSAKCELTASDASVNNYRDGQRDILTPSSEAAVKDIVGTTDVITSPETQVKLDGKNVVDSKLPPDQKKIVDTQSIIPDSKSVVDVPKIVDSATNKD